MSAQTVSHESEQGRSEMVRGAPHPSLRAHVREYVGWLVRSQLPDGGGFAVHR